MTKRKKENEDARSKFPKLPKYFSTHYVEEHGYMLSMLREMLEEWEVLYKKLPALPITGTSEINTLQELFDEIRRFMEEKDYV